MEGNNMAYRNALTRAASGNFPTDNTYIVYWIEIIQNSQNIANNTTNVTVKVWCKRTNTGYTTTGNGTCYCTINGTQYSASHYIFTKYYKYPKGIIYKDNGHCPQL